PGGVKVVVKEDSDVVLPCSLSTKENIVPGVFAWRKDTQKDEGLKEVFYYDAGIHYNNGRPGQSEEFKGRVSHFPDELKHGNSSIIIRNTKISDSGEYTCYFPRLQPPQIFYIELLVAVTPKPSVTILDATADWALLQCEVHGASLTSGVEWKDSAGNTLPAEETRTPERDHYYITLNTTVTKTDHYLCVVTQEEISHQTHAEIFVHISEKVCEDSSSKVAEWMIGGFVLGALTLIIVHVLLVVAKIITIRCVVVRGSRQLGNSLINQGKDLGDQQNDLGDQGIGSCEELSEILDPNTFPR
ncbi:butyrophilin subfamily 1 member A1-like, partial [Sander lucioperca]|uniref:butyrophilin subfamily 1 member A1-like n=1 Tax=Sander lucioperca TaxID=283035 RepID=UPI001653DB05